MSRTTETRHIKCHKNYKCECRLDTSLAITNNVGIKINADVNSKN